MKSLATRTVGSISPPKDHLELGDRIRYHHRACVARIPKSRHTGSGVFDLPPIPAEWNAIEQEGGAPPFTGFGTSNFPGIIADRTKRNKTIMVWPEEGEGYIIALIRRGIGKSHEGYTSGYEYPEYEPGYFEAQEWHWLYVVKQTLLRMGFIYVPMWGVAC